jgi:CheY-like chemotaxis protein
MCARHQFLIPIVIMSDKSPRMNRFLCNICLLVNDNPLDHDLFGEALSDVSPKTTCCVATSSQEALALIVDEQIIPDIIFIEAESSGINAIEFLTLFKSEPFYRNVPVIVHTKSVNKRKIKKIKAAGATAIYPREYRYDGILNIFFIYHLPELILLQLN